MLVRLALILGLFAMAACTTPAPRLDAQERLARHHGPGSPVTRGMK